MPERKRSVASDVTRQLRAARVAATTNYLPGPRVREWARDYLQRRDEEARTEPGDAPDPALPHWNLLMQDGGSEPGFFVAIVFHRKPRGFELVAGTGDSYEVRHYCEHEAPEEADGLLDALRERFTVPRAPLRVGRKAARQWLGRDW